MSFKKFPDYVDEKYRIEFVKSAKENVYWISTYFSAKETEVLDEIRHKISYEKVWICECQKSTINDEGYCFSIDEKNRHISVKLRLKNSEKLNKSLLVVDNIACIYNHESNKDGTNARFLKDIGKVEFNELIRRLNEEKIIQINLLDNYGGMRGLESLIKTNSQEEELTKDNTLSINSNLSVKVDVVLGEIQARIKKISIKTPGIKTDIRHIEINDILNLIGKFDSKISERLVLRWKVFGDDNIMKEEYRILKKELEAMKDGYTINLNSFGRFILVRDVKSFEDQIKKFRKKLKNNSINIIQKKTAESMTILENLTHQFYSYAKSESDTLKTCSDFELENIIEIIKSKFPKITEVVDNSDVIISYTELSKNDISNKELCRQLLNNLDNVDKELYQNLEKIVKY